MSVSRTVSEIFSAKEWRDLETRGTGLSRSSPNVNVLLSNITFFVIFAVLDVSQVYINKKAQKRYISPICPEAHSGWICTKFGLGGPLADVINCAEFCYLCHCQLVVPKMNCVKRSHINSQGLP